MSNKKTDIWMPLYIGDYLADTMHLTTEQHGAYLLLIIAYWRNQGPLPDDNKRLASICKLPLEQWLIDRPSIEEFFKTDGLFWVHGRIDSELAESLAFKLKQQQNGKKGGRPSKNNPNESQTIPKAYPNESPSPSPSPSHIKQPSLNTNIIALDWAPSELDLSEIASNLGVRVIDLAPMVAAFAGHYAGKELNGPLGKLQKWCSRELEFKKQNGG